jgi:L-cysteate sulfo-lyase
MSAPFAFVTAATPLEPAPRLAAAIGLAPGDLFIKRDDLIGLGGGGNKVRKLQYSCAEALAASATVLITTGAPQSNHARLTAAAGARLGMRVILVLEGEAPSTPVGNLILDGLLGAEIVWAGSDALGERAREVAAELAASGTVAHIIPFGGTSATTAVGYADAARELLDQDPGFDHLVVAVGSGGTMAGLVSVLGPERVLGVDCGAMPDARAAVEALVEEMTGAPVTGLRLDRDQVGAGYGHLVPAVADAMRLMARTEGLLIDPVYTGRALAGLVDAVRNGVIHPGQRTIFLHTGGLAGLFGHPEITSI